MDQNSIHKFPVSSFLSPSFIFPLLDNALPWAFKTQQFSTVVTRLLTRLLSKYEVHVMASSSANNLITSHLHVQKLVLAIQILMQLMEMWRWLLKSQQRFSIDNSNSWFLQHSILPAKFHNSFYRLLFSLDDTETVQ